MAETPAEFLALLPPAGRIEPLSLGREELVLRGQRLAARAVALRPGALEADGLAHGLLRVTEGRAPSAEHEVALSPVVARGLACRPGDTVELGGRALFVSGLAVDPESLDLPIVLRAAGAEGERGASHWLVEIPSAEAERVAGELRALGREVVARAELGQRDAFEAMAIFVLGGFAFFEAALVISAAMAVGVRRRQREIGLLGAAGASPAELQLALCASALVVAAGGVLLGLALALASSAALHPFLDGWNRRQNGPFEISWWHAAGAAGLALTAALGAVWLPSRGAARLPIRVALAGRRPASESSAPWLATGLVLIGLSLGAVLWGTRSAGSAAAVAILGGSIAGVLGLGAVSPWLLGALARLAGPLPLSWRLAVRDAGRFRARNGPVVTAVLAGLSVSVTLSALIASIEARIAGGPALLRDDQVLLTGPGAESAARDLSAELGALGVAPLWAAGARGSCLRARSTGSGEPPAEAWVAVGGEDLWRALGLEAAGSELRAGHATALSSAAGELELVDGHGRVLGRLAARAFEPAQRVRTPLYALGIDALPALGLEPCPPPGAEFAPWILRLPDPVRPEQIQRALEVAARAPSTIADAALLHREPASRFLYVVLALCFATGLIVVFVATALSAVESAADARTLHAVGAPPRWLRTHAAARAGYLAALGCTLAIPAGLIPGLGLLALAEVPLEFTGPWRELLLVGLGLPGAAFAGAWIGAAPEHGARARLRTDT